MKKSKVSKRIMAVTLSVAMMMSNMTVTATEEKAVQETAALEETEQAVAQTQEEDAEQAESVSEAGEEASEQESSKVEESLEPESSTQASGSEETTESETSTEEEETTQEETTTEEETTEEETTTEELTLEEVALLEGPVEANLYVAPDADGNGDGLSADSPMDLETALKTLEAGYSIELQAGTYSFDETILIEESNSGTSSKHKSMIANGEVILDFSAMGYTGSEADKAKRGVILDGSYWDIYGVTFKGAADNGMLLSGDHNTLEMCVFTENHDTGLQVSRYQTSYANISQWPSNNLIKNCTSYNNSDITGENADGFAAKLTCGEGNVFDGCMSYNNSDDGWDLYAKTATGPIGVVTLKNCIAFRNGKLTDGSGSAGGDMNGFKLGGSGVGTPHVLINCIAFENGAHGFTDNNNPTAVTLVNCTSFNNSVYSGSKKANFQMNRENGGVNANLLSFNTSKIGSDGFIGTIQNSIYYNNKPVYYHVTDTVSVTGKDKVGEIVTISADDFKSVSAPAATTNFHKEWRNADGSINTKGFLAIASDSELATMATDGKAIGSRLANGEYMNSIPSGVDSTVKEPDEDKKDDEKDDTTGEGGENVTLNISDMDVATISATTSAGAFTINATSSKTVVIDENSKTIDEFEFTKRMKLGGTGKATSKDNYRNIQYTATDAATMTVYAMSGSSSADRALALVNADGATVATQTALGAEISKLTFEIPSAGTYYLLSTSSGINVYYVAVAYAQKEEEPELPEVDPVESVEGKIDVWDLGAEQLDTEKYTNMLDADTINSWYDSVEAGATGKNLASFEVKDSDGNVAFCFNDGGYSTTHRLRSSNQALTRYDDKTIVYDGVTYTGYIYSNKSSTKDVYVGIRLEEGDILTAIVSSNNGPSTVAFEAPSGKTETQEYDKVDKATSMTIYAAETGLYKIYSTNEKLVLARAYVEHTQPVNVVGFVNAPSDLTAEYAITFTCKESGAVVEAPVSNGTYSAVLREGYSYEVALKNADGYVVTSSETLTLAAGDGGENHYKQFDVTVGAVDLVKIKGQLKGLDEEAAAKLKLELKSENIYVPTVTVKGTEYTATVESGVEYTLEVSGIDDYNLAGDTKLQVSEAGTVDITFEKRPVYTVTIQPKGATLADLEKAEFTFTRHSDEDKTEEEDYVYTFTGTEDIKLRDGIYTVKVENTGDLKQKLTSNLVVSGADVTKTIAFSSNSETPTSWDFRSEDYTGQTEYEGLVINGGKKHGSQYGMMIKNGTIEIPVQGESTIKVSVGYNWDIVFDENTEEFDKTNSGDKELTYEYTGKKGTYTLIVGTQCTSYIKSISVVAKATGDTTSDITLTVGKSGCDYTTINDALDAVRSMSRGEEQRVIIEIQPGDYEEMLVVDVANVTLVNASKNPSIETKNKGVDIDDNAVRITSYYGHGYTYYSMGSDCKYDEELLAVNKENGYASFENPGSGTTNGSYWNATVVITASGFEAEGIIFENSFNQYVSKKAAADVIVAQSSAKEGSVARADMSYGDTTVQNKKYVERAAALAIANNCKQVSFDNCKFIGRQDTLYGGTDVTAAFYDCAVYGGTDYIFGAMTAVFAKCDLVLNTMEDNNDVAYITAAQQKSGRGYLMYNCNIVSTTPGVDTASEEVSKPGYFGRPWQGNTSEVVYYATIIGQASDGSSLIAPIGWNSTLGGTSDNVYEYNTYEMVKGIDNSASRADWSHVITEPKLTDGTTISVEAFLGDWDAFAGKDMEVKIPDGKLDPVDPDEPDKSDTKEFVLETNTLTSFGAGTKADGDTENAGTDNYFTIIYSAKSKVDSSSKTFDDGYESAQRINFGGKVSTEKNALKFTTSSAAKVKVWWAEGGDDNRQVAILDSTGAVAATTSETLAKNAVCISELELAEAGTYYLGFNPNNSYLFKVVVTESDGNTDKPERQDWSKVATPSITDVALTEDGTGITVTAKAQIGYDGADKAVISMLNAEGEEVDSKNSLKEGGEITATFTPDASGAYSFKVTLIREEETDKVSKVSDAIDFVLPLTAPSIKSATNVGEGSVELEWEAVEEADGYVVAVKDSKQEIKTKELTAVVEDLKVGEEYTFTVAATRKDEVGPASEITAKVTQESQMKWAFSAFGQGVDTKNNGYEGNANDGSVRVYSTGGKGKIVPGSTDGLAFYYTEIDPETTNFTLTATAKVNKWKLSNGQEGFGLMAADAVGSNGDNSVFWNNSYMASVTKVEYMWDGEKVSDSGSKISMKLGIGSQEKKGVAAENIKEDKTLTDMSVFSTAMKTLETSCAANGSGTYNIVGGYEGAQPTGTIDNAYTEFKLTIQKNNTGYFVSYTDASGNTTTNKYYGTDVLNHIDTDSVYVGFFASRNADITFSDISFTTIAPEDDEPAEEKPTTQVTPSYSIISATTANSADYQLIYNGNADGVLNITDSLGNTVVSKDDVKADEKVTADVTLHFGDNKFKVTFTPDKDYKPSESEVLSSYDAVSFDFTVNYRAYGQEGCSLYVAPNGSESGNGTKENPLDIYTAVKYVQAGQTIVITEGTYELSRTVKVERGINGTADNMIYMVADPEASTRPVFDFGGKCAGMVLAGDYWYFKGFDVTGSADAQKGIQVSGDHNTLDLIETYKNGNTGIQISRYLTTDEFEDWPSDNLILNCTSYENADKGYEDADGFAAKLTVGNGNVFDGCIAHHNADDGWDLFAKVQTGNIGKVIIKNCVAYKNGYVTNANGNEVNAGNGNGFKMGGDSMSGYHELHNSIAFFNKAKGIDSNSCPDIQVYDSVSYNNESYNVAFYTNSAVNTDYKASGVVSYRTEYMDQTENLKGKGTQDSSKIYSENNFYWDVASKTSVNSKNVAVSSDWFKSIEFTGIDRNADGTINTHGFLSLTDKALAGGEIGGTASGDHTIGDVTNGDISKDDNSGDNNNGGNNNGGNNDGNSSSGNDNSTSSSASSNSGSTQTTASRVQTTTVTIADGQTPLAATPTALPEGYTYEQTVVESDGVLRAALLQKYYGQKVYFAAIFGKDAAMTVDMQSVSAVSTDMKLGYTLVEIPAFADGFVTVHAIPTQRTVLPFQATLHFNIDSAYAGKAAYIYLLDADAAKYSLIKTMNVNEIGNVALDTDQFTDVIVMIAQ